MPDQFKSMRLLLAYAFRVSLAIKDGVIGPEICRRPINIITGDEGVHLPSDNDATQSDLQDWADNMVMLALYGSALGCHELIDSARGPVLKDKEHLGLRVLVYQLRNAVAHRPWQPKWKIDERYRHDYPITLLSGRCFTFEASKLNGRFVKPEDFGGLESWLDILWQCEGMVAP